MLAATEQGISRIADSFRALKDELGKKFPAETGVIQSLIDQPEQDIVAAQESVAADKRLLHSGVEGLQQLTELPFEGDFKARKVDLDTVREDQRVVTAGFNAGALAERGRMIGAFRNAIGKVVETFLTPKVAAEV